MEEMEKQNPSFLYQYIKGNGYGEGVITNLS